jgi:tRNA dimethylallyltransferase
MSNKIIVILGPTSSGKSDIAIKIAKKFNGEVISADSRQIYRGMDIGTGKVPCSKFKAQSSKPQLKIKKYKDIYYSDTIPHYMIDIINPRTNYNVAKFKRQAEKIIADVLRRGKLPIICGGTGFWIQAIVDDVNFPEVKPDWKLRQKLEKNSTEKLFSMLKKLDPKRAKTIDRKNKVRLIRAIEIAKVLGKVPVFSNPKLVIRNSDKNNSNYQLPITNYDFLQIGLKISKGRLYKNIEKRVLTRFKQGVIKEIEKLRSSGLSWKKIQSFGLVYFWIPLYLQKKLSKSLALRNSKSLALGRKKPSFRLKSLASEKKFLIEKVIQAEKNYAKRQMTWFKRDKRIKWLEDYRKMQKVCIKFLRR